jgi:outer membrane protein assembly factor BamA
MRLRVQLGTERQDYEISFTEPWFLNRKLALGVDLYRINWTLKVRTAFLTKPHRHEA